MPLHDDINILLQDVELKSRFPEVRARLNEPTAPPEHLAAMLDRTLESQTVVMRSIQAALVQLAGRVPRQHWDELGEIYQMVARQTKLLNTIYPEE